MVASAQFREKVIAWVVETFEKYSIFELQSDGENTQSDLQSYKPTYLPDGAELKNTVEQPEMLAYEYAINESGYFNILLSQSDTRIYADAENTEIESFDKGGVIGYYFKKDDLNYICYERDGDFFSIYGSIDMDELIKIAAGITTEWYTHLSWTNRDFRRYNKMSDVYKNCPAFENDKFLLSKWRSNETSYWVLA